MSEIITIQLDKDVYNKLESKKYESESLSDVIRALLEMKKELQGMPDHFEGSILLKRIYLTSTDLEPLMEQLEVVEEFADDYNHSFFATINKVEDVKVEHTTNLEMVVEAKTEKEVKTKLKSLLTDNIRKFHPKVTIQKFYQNSK